MNIYEIKSIGDRIKGNPYVGRGIVLGKSVNGKNAVSAYFIMGRSANSRNRVFEKDSDGTVFTKPFDPSKVEDPSLIIYAAVRDYNNNHIVTNGDQTDTIWNALKFGGTFESGLNTREFEPDFPNFTPRISGMITYDNNDFSYKMSILKSADDKGTECNRYYFNYNSIAGLGHFIHTYVTDGDPIPTFQGEPERVLIPDNIEEFADDIWNNLDEDNKISLIVRYTDIETGKTQEKLINKY